MPRDARAAGLVEARQLFPIQIRQPAVDVLALGAGFRQAEQPVGCLVEVEDAPGFIRDQHAVLDGVEERFEKRPLTRQPLDDGLQALGIEPSDAAENLVEEAGFGSGHGRVS